MPQRYDPSRDVVKQGARTTMRGGFRIATSAHRPAPTAVRTWLIAAAMVVVAGCAGAESTGSAPASPTPVPSPAPTQPAQASEPAVDDASPGAALPGEPIDFFFSDGDELAVVGVAADDVLNVRAAPGTDADIVTTLAPLATDVIATGAVRQLPRSFWAEVEADGTRGWASVAFLAYLGPTDDVTEQVRDDLGDATTAETMLDLGTAVAETRASTDPPSTITIVDGPMVGDLGEITLDVIGLGDDAQAGVRLAVFGQPLESGDGFDLKSVEETALCARGGSPTEGCA